MPVDIAKPWGKEIWYTGMEVRGESQVLIGDQQLNLSSYLAADPAALTQSTPVLLLKVLDPKPQAVVGDLYFEVHEHKQEVYVVTHIDQGAWPDGVGGIRFGMNQVKRKQYSRDEAFRAEYLQAVKHYEQVRRQIDEQGAGVDPADEQSARQQMNSFTNMRELRIADVVRVPTWTPHSLLHGVRVVEFQSASYERFIISFAQKVVTQPHWDSEHAIENMHLEPPQPESFEAVADGVERIASFSDFNVWRMDLSVAGPATLPPHIPYAICMCVTGRAQVGDLELEPEQACFIPFSALAGVALGGAGTALVAAPDL